VQSGGQTGEKPRNSIRGARKVLETSCLLDEEEAPAGAGASLLIYFYSREWSNGNAHF
jgi:hypothetical protein